MSWVALALAVAAVVVAGRWCARRVDELGRRRDFPLVGVALLAVLAVGAATPGVLHARQERRLAAAASALAGHLDESAVECAAVQRDAAPRGCSARPAARRGRWRPPTGARSIRRCPAATGPPPAGRAAPWTSTSRTPPWAPAGA